MEENIDMRKYFDKDIAKILTLNLLETDACTNTFEFPQSYVVMYIGILATVYGNTVQCNIDRIVS